MNREIRVWDPLVRIFHWSLLLSFLLAYLTAEEGNALHINSGYAVLGLISFRLVWGLVGSKYARFSNFIKPPGVFTAYLRNLLAGEPERFVGHNPAGGWMIVALLISLLVVTVSGLKVYAIEEGLGPLAGTGSELVIGSAWADPDRGERDDEEDDGDEGERQHRETKADERDEEFWEEIHEASTNITLLLIFLHIAGVLVTGRLHHENLVKAMFTGRKRLT